MRTKKVPATLLLLFFAIEALDANRRKQKDKIVPTIINICDIKGRDPRVHCYCKIRQEINEAIQSACWVFNGGIDKTDPVWESFTSQPNIETLEFDVRSDGALDFVPSTVLQHVKKLKNFTIKLGSISTVESYTFSNHSSLQEIILKNNEIVNLSRHSFFNISNLTTLNLDNNRITELVTDTFALLSALKQLFFIGNNINVIQGGAFRGLANLNELRLDNNNVSELKKECFDGLANLKVLDLRSNKIAVLNSLTFTELWSLESLMLDYNEIVTLGERAFDGLSQLKKLTMSYNNLVTLIGGLFKGIRGVSVLDLSHNKLIKFTYEDVLPIYDNLKNYSGYINLDGNEFTCDCHLAWMHQLRHETKNANVRKYLENFLCKVSVDFSFSSHFTYFEQSVINSNKFRKADDKKPIRNNSDNSGDIFHDEIDDAYPDEPKLERHKNKKTLLQIPVKSLPCTQIFKTVTDRTYTHPSQNEAKDYRNLIESSMSAANNVSLLIFLFTVSFLLRY